MRISDWSSDVCSSDLEKVRWKAESDSWPAFPTTRRAVLNTIIKNGVQNVVFLSGDIHCANVAAIEFTGSPAAQKLKAFSITSSAFYWPFPFAAGEPSSYVHDSRPRAQLDPKSEARRVGTEWVS